MFIIRVRAKITFAVHVIFLRPLISETIDLAELFCRDGLPSYRGMTLAQNPFQDPACHPSFRHGCERDFETALRK